MTRYLLNSGGSKNNPEKLGKFNQEIVRGLRNNPRVLFCFFASPREDWEEKFTNYSMRFLESMSEGITPELELASPDQFENQLKNSDALIIHGGDDDLLLSRLKQYNLPKLWEGKTVVGSSAGSNILVKHFWTCDWRQVRDGLGILPIKFIPHYKSSYGENDSRGPIDWAKAHNELTEYGDKNLPLHALEEGDFIIIEQ